MRNHVEVLRYKAKKDPKVQAYIDQAREGSISIAEVQELDEPPWLKNSLKFMIESNQTYSFKEKQAMVASAIRWFDDSDKTEYQCFEYQGSVRFIGDRFQAELRPGDRILIKNSSEFVLRNAEKTFGPDDLAGIQPHLVSTEKQTILDFKADYQRRLNREYNSDDEKTVNNDNELFKIRRY